MVVSRAMNDWPTRHCTRKKRNVEMGISVKQSQHRSDNYSKVSSLVHCCFVTRQQAAHPVAGEHKLSFVCPGCMERGADWVDKTDIPGVFDACG